MRRIFAIPLSIIALCGPAAAETAKPDPGECAAAAEVTIHDWQGRLAKARSADDAEVARQQITRAEAVRRVTGNPATPPALHRKYMDLNPDLRDFFVVRCALKLGAI